MTEAVNNAFIHGNNSDKNKSIFVQWNLEEDLLSVTVTDCGFGVKHLKNYKEIDEDNILDEWGRGLYIISSYSDEVKIKGNSIIMKKHLL